MVVNLKEEPGTKCLIHYKLSFQMTKDKYYWKIGQPPPDIEQHSIIKNKILEGYIESYVMTVMAQARIPELKLSIVDGFCGGGLYKDFSGNLVDGSPPLIMKAIREARARLNLARRTPRIIDVNYIFIDILKDTTDYLKWILRSQVDEMSLDYCDYEKTQIYTDNFLRALPNVINDIKSRRMGERAIFVLDQYSYDNIPLKEINNILFNIRKSEVILTFNVASLITFISDRAENRKPLKRLGLEQYIPWSELNSIKATEKQRWRQILQRHLAHGIQMETGAKFMTLFFVKPLGLNSWDYWLIHLANNYKAHEVMKTLHWNYSTEFGHELEPGYFLLGYNANDDSKYTGQQTFDFGGSSKVACVNGIREHFGHKIFELDKPVSVAEIFESSISNSTAAEIHLMEATRQLHSSKDIIVRTKDGKIRKLSAKYNADDIIEPSRNFKIQF